MPVRIKVEWVFPRTVKGKTVNKEVLQEFPVADWPDSAAKTVMSVYTEPGVYFSGMEDFGADGCGDIHNCDAPVNARECAENKRNNMLEWFERDIERLKDGETNDYSLTTRGRKYGRLVVEMLPQGWDAEPEEEEPEEEKPKRPGQMTELGLDDDLPGSRWARSAQAQMHRDAHDSELEHDFKRLPSYEGYAGMCSGCGWEPDGSFESSYKLTAAYSAHVIDAYAAKYEIGEVLGIQKFAPPEEREDWVGRAADGGLIAGALGWVQVDNHANVVGHGMWIKVSRPEVQG